MNHQPVYYPEVKKALANIQNMTEEQLLEQLDVLYGRSRLPEHYSLDQLKAEAIRQVRLDFLNPQHPNYQTMLKVLS